MYGHRCQDTQSPFRVRAESSRVSFPQITKVCWQRVIIQCVWLISIKWWHKILYCYRPSRLSHFEHPEVGPGVRAVRPGGDSLTCTRREGEREPALTLERGDLWSWSLSQGRRYLTPGYLRAGGLWQATPAVAGTRCRPGQSPAGHRAGNILGSRQLQELSFSSGVTVASD